MVPRDCTTGERAPFLALGATDKRAIRLIQLLSRQSQAEVQLWIIHLSRPQVKGSPWVCLVASLTCVRLPDPGADRRNSQVCSRIRYIRKLRDFPVEASELEVSSTGNPLTTLLTRWCLHGVKKAWPERRASYLCC